MSESEEDPPTPLRRRWATVLLTTMNVSVFLAMMVAGVSPLMIPIDELVAAGAIDPVRVWQGEIWRLFTACFVHAGVWHVGMNVLVLWVVGTPLERFVGGSRTLLIYVTSGAFGFACSVSLMGVPTTGASGAVFGVVGAMLALAVVTQHADLKKAVFDAFMPLVVATFILSLLVPVMDNSAHVGGLLFGFVLGYGLSRNAGEEKGGAIWDLTVLMASALVFAIALLYAGRPALSPKYHAVVGMQALVDDDLPKAQRHYRSAALLAPDDPLTFLLLARVKDANATSDADRDEARRLVRIALTGLDEDPQEAFEKAIAMLALATGGGAGDVGMRDNRTAALICDGALWLVLDTPSQMAPILKNACAWLFLKSPDPRVHDPAAGLALAREAVEESGGREAMIVHTLAEALAQSGDPAEGLAHLEKLVAMGRTGGLPSGFLDEERARLRRLVSEQDAAANNHVGSR